LGLGTRTVLQSLTIGTDRTVAAVLRLGVAVGIALARLVVEPSTTATAFS